MPFDEWMQELTSKWAVISLESPLPNISEIKKDVSYRTLWEAGATVQQIIDIFTWSFNS